MKTKVAIAKQSALRLTPIGALTERPPRCRIPVLLKMLAGSLLLWGILLNSAVAATLPSGFTEALVAGGLSSPTAMEFAPDGRLFVCQQGGQLRVIKNGSLLATPFLTVTVHNTGERGLLGIAFDPNFAVNKYVYVYYTTPDPEIHNRVSRFTANGDVAVAGSEVVLLNLNNLSGAANHNGGGLHFGNDGKLYIAVGDNANSANAQTLGNLLGKMLRLNSDGTIPTDNPFYNTASGVNRSIWALGLRNPFTFAVQPGTGRMFINDVGQDTWEEINEAVAGANYGWPNCEGFCSPANPSYRDPIFRYVHGTGNSSGYCIAGGTFYNPATTQFPSSNVGVYFFADYVNGWIRKLDPAQGNQVTTFATGISEPVDLKVGADGRLYYLARGNGAVYAISYFVASQPPQITQQPVDQNALAGQPATFTVAASGTAPLSYRWQRNGTWISGATSSSYTLASATTGDDGVAFRCAVTNASGAITSNPAFLHVTSDSQPAGTITAPANGTLYTAGDTIQYGGAATDPEDGDLPASAFSWTIMFHHGTHSHPFLGPINSVTNGSFVIPTQGETAANVWYRIHLAVTDSDGQTETNFVDVVPRTANVTLATSPSGLQLTLDGQPVATPVTVLSVVGIQRTLGVVSPQTVGGTTYQFGSWSDGGAASHGINSPATATTYTATYQAVNQPPVANNDSYIVTMGVTLNVSAPGVLSNDTDANGNPLTATLVSGPAQGILSLNANGSFSYSPTAGYSGPDNFTYRANDGTTNSGVATVNLTVSGSGTTHYDFTYANRASLLAGGWDFLARTVSGATRNTEQTSGAVVDYNQTTHPGVLRIPTDAGDLWKASNNSRNSLFRGLPANWTSVRLNLSFAPTQNYQQASLVAYQDDDNYVQVTREFNGGNKMALVREAAGSPTTLQVANFTATANLHLRLDRNVTTERITGSYSQDGVNWTALGTGVVQPLNNPRLAIFVGASPGGFPNADLMWVEVISPTQSGPVLTVSPTSLTFSAAEGNNPANQSLGIINGGGGALNWTAVADGSAPAWLTLSPANGTGNGAVNVSVSSASLAPGAYSKSITVTAPGATNSPQTVIVNLTVNSTAPALTLNPTALNFSTVQGNNPANQMLGIANSGGGTLNWTAVADGTAPAWLSVSPANGTGNANVNVNVASTSLPPGNYTKSITVTASGATNSPQTVTVNLTVNPVNSSGVSHFDFTYANRASLLAGGWNFLARTAAGATRDTEQTSGTMVNYDQSVHPGVLRIPTDIGDLWGTANNSRNSLFRDLPAGWTSLRLKLSFAPTQNYQQAGLVAYQDDNNYLAVTRIYNGGNKVSFVRENGGAAAVLQSATVTATANLHLRLDRNAATGSITGYYSLNGTNWTAVGSGVVQTLNNPRLAIFVGASSGGYPNADLMWAEVIAPQAAAALANSSISLIAPGLANEKFGFGFQTSPGVSYRVEYKAVLSDPDWTTLTNLVGTGAYMSVVDPANLSASRFYRVCVP